MGESQPALSQLEQSEVSGRAQLGSIRKAAAALDCDLVYALVPRTSLEHTMRARARVIARRDLAPGDEEVDAGVLDQRIDHYADRLVDGGRLWDDRDAD